MSIASEGESCRRKATACVEPTSRVPDGHTTRTANEERLTLRDTTTLMTGCDGFAPGDGADNGGERPSPASAWECIR